MTLPAISDLKAQARRLRNALAAGGQSISHGQALEIVSVQHGFRDWNTISAAASASIAMPFSVCERVSGTYFRQHFTGEIRGLEKVGHQDHFRVTLQFDEPVDVVTFDSFSAHRSRISCVVRADGVAIRKTSDGEPYLKMKACV